MIQDKDCVYLQHILECIQYIKQYSTKGQEDFNNNQMAQDAILRRLQTMSESTLGRSKMMFIGYKETYSATRFMSLQMWLTAA